MSSWHIEGQYMETCNCTYLCPCIASNLAAQPSEGDCKAAIAMRIDTGHKDGVKLDGLSFIVMLHSPAAMDQGDITVGLIVDERASDAQVEAISAIATSAAGGRWRTWRRWWVAWRGRETADLVRDRRHELHGQGRRARRPGLRGRCQRGAAWRAALSGQCRPPGQ